MTENDQALVQSHLDLDQRIRQRAHELWEARSHGDGATALQDWLAAEKEILGGATAAQAQSRGTIVGDARKPGPDRLEGLGES